MGREIDLTQPLSDEDRQWLEDRGKYSDLRINADILGTKDEVESVDDTDSAGVAEDGDSGDNAGDGGDDNDGAGDGDDDGDFSGAYAEWTGDQLREECEARGLPKGGNKAELIARLEAAN